MPWLRIWCQAWLNGGRACSRAASRAASPRTALRARPRPQSPLCGWKPRACERAWVDCRRGRAGQPRLVFTERTPLAHYPRTAGQVRLASAGRPPTAARAQVRRDLTAGRLPPVQPFHAMAYPFSAELALAISAKCARPAPARPPGFPQCAPGFLGRRGCRQRPYAAVAPWAAWPRELRAAECVWLHGIVVNAHVCLLHDRLSHAPGHAGRPGGADRVLTGCMVVLGSLR